MRRHRSWEDEPGLSGSGLYRYRHRNCGGTVTLSRSHEERAFDRARCSNCAETFTRRDGRFVWRGFREADHA